MAFSSLNLNLQFFFRDMKKQILFLLLFFFLSYLHALKCIYDHFAEIMKIKASKSILQIRLRAYYSQLS